MAEEWKNRDRKRSTPHKPGYMYPHHHKQIIKEFHTPARVATAQFHLARRSEAEERARIYNTVINDDDLLDYHTSYVYACISVLLIIKYYDRISRDGGRGISITREYGEHEGLARLINRNLSVYPDKNVISLFNETRDRTTQVYKLNYNNLFPDDRQPKEIRVDYNPALYKNDEKSMFKDRYLNIPPPIWAHYIYYMKRVRFYRIVGVHDKSLFMNSLESGELYPVVIDDTILKIVSEYGYLFLYDYVHRMLVSTKREDKLQIKYPRDYGEEDKLNTAAASSSRSAAASYAPSSSTAASYAPSRSAAASSRSEANIRRNHTEGAIAMINRAAASSEYTPKEAEPEKKSGWFSSFFGGSTRKQTKSKRRSHRKSTRKSKPSQ